MNALCGGACPSIRESERHAYLRHPFDERRKTKHAYCRQKIFHAIIHVDFRTFVNLGHRSFGGDIQWKWLDRRLATLHATRSTNLASVNWLSIAH